MDASRIRPRIATVLAVSAIGAVSLGLTGAGSASGNDKARPPAPSPPASPSRR